MARLALLAYSLLFYLAMPLVWLRLLWRGRRQPAYRQQHFGERHALYPASAALWAAAVDLVACRFGR
jgi:3-deoxy-D-manno-octulosonic-acid transferase